MYFSQTVAEEIFVFKGLKNYKTKNYAWDFMERKKERKKRNEMKSK